MPAVTAELADFVAGLTFNDLPAEVLEKLRLHFLDLVGAQILGSRQHWNELVRDYALSQSSAGPSSFIATEIKGRPSLAAMANATMAQGFETDDYHSAAVYHPGAMAIPPAVAVAEQVGASDEEFLTAVAAGFEVGIRVGMGAAGGLAGGGAARGFHSPTTVGPFAAAAAAGKLLGFDSKTMLHAFGIAGSHAGGTIAYSQSGGEVKRFHAGLGCNSGIRAAELAQAGLTGPSAILEGEMGFYKVLSNNMNLDLVTGGLGEKWQTLDSAMKRYTVFAGIQASLQAIHDMVAKDALKAEDVEAIEIGMDAVGARGCGHIGPRPKEMIQAQFSLHFSIGLALTEGGNDYADYLAAEKAGFELPRAIEIAEKVSVHVDDLANSTYLQNRSAHIVVRLKNGSTLERRLNAPGSAASPLPAEEVKKKFRSQTGICLDAEGVKTLEDTILGMSGGRSLAGMMAIIARSDLGAE